GFHFGKRHQRQQRHVRAAPLYGIQQGLVLQIADENVLFVIWQPLVIDAVLRDIDFLGTPEERELLFDQFLEDRVFLLVIASNIDRLPKEHGFLELVIVDFRKNTVAHSEIFPQILQAPPAQSSSNSELRSSAPSRVLW